MKERTKLLLIVAVFATAYLLPVESPRLQRSFLEGLFLLKDYARRHVLLCPAPSGRLMQLNQSIGHRRAIKLSVDEKAASRTHLIPKKGGGLCCVPPQHQRSSP